MYEKSEDDPYLVTHFFMELCGMLCWCCLSLHVSVDYNAFFNWRLIKEPENGHDCKFVFAFIQ